MNECSNNSFLGDGKFTLLRANIKRHSNIVNDEFTQFVYDNYDIQNKETVINELSVNIEAFNNWNIGVIFGKSGSGKTTILKEFGEIKTANFNNYPIISNFNFTTPENASKLLSSVGLNSIPNWLKPYNVLSNGEKYRAELAYRIGIEDKLILVDEYTSIVDRNTAISMSNAIQKNIRKQNKQIIFATAHEDVIEWLQPDWVYSVEENKCFYPKKKSQQLKPKFSGVEMKLGRCSKNIII